MELSAKEEALVAPIVAEIAKAPGLPVRDLGVLIHRNMSVTLRVVQKLVDAGVLERRQVPRVRSDRHERTYSGLFFLDRPQPETMGTPTVPVAVAELSPQRMALHELGQRLGYGRLPLSAGESRGGAFLAGRAIQAGEEAWLIAVESLADEDVEVALVRGRQLLALLQPTAATG